MTNTDLKAQIDAQITNETENGGITPTDVGSNMKLVVDYVDQEQALKAPITSPSFIGTVSGVTKSMVGLGNVDNTSDLSKPVSTATQSALDLKIDFKVYKAKLSQSGTDNVTASILKNDTGKTFTYSRNSTGSYNFTFSSLYADVSKIDIYIHLQNGSYVAPQVLIDNLGILAMIETKYWNGTNFVLSDGILQNATIYLVVNN